MWKAIRNISSAVADIVIIGSKEVGYQVGKASDSTDSVTSKLSAKAANIRAGYEQHLAERKSGTIKSEVVTEEEIPKEAVAIN